MHSLAPTLPKAQKHTLPRERMCTLPPDPASSSAFPPKLLHASAFPFECLGLGVFGSHCTGAPGTQRGISLARIQIGEAGF